MSDIESASLCCHDGSPRGGWGIVCADEGALDVLAVFFGARAVERADAVCELLYGRDDDHGVLPLVAMREPMADDNGWTSPIHVANVTIRADAIRALAEKFGLDRGAWL